MNQYLAPIAILFLVVTGCSSVQNESNSCKITPAQTASGSQEAALKAAADLSKFAKAPVTANLEASIKKTFDATFQEVPDTEAACSMLLQTYTCIDDKDRASEFLKYMQNSTACGHK